MTSLAWVVLDIVPSDPGEGLRRERAARPVAGPGIPRRQFKASTELCKICNPRLHSPQLRYAVASGCPRNNLSRRPGFGLRMGPPSWGNAVPARLDAIDWKILKELQDDGRITNVELARRVGISAPPCLRRVRALEEAGFIKGYRALLDEKLLGYEVTVFAMVHLVEPGRGRPQGVRGFRAQASRWCANAGCCPARSTSCSSAWRRT